MSSHCALILLITVWASLHDGLSLPVTEHTDAEASDSVLPPHRVRTKRCSCSNQLDSECHYFCHLDIIWVNTPSKTTVYGLGSALSRRRRSAGRCACANPADHSCASFCHNSPDIPSPKNAANMPQTNLLSILRSVASMSARLRDVALLDHRSQAGPEPQNQR